MRPYVFFLSFFLFLPSLFADETFVTAIHMHSQFSSGGQSIPVMAEEAKKQGIDVLFLTDQYYEKYEYGIQPLQGIIKKSYERNSIMKWGAQNYLQQIEQASRETPEVLLIDGTAVTPFYYWSGQLWPGPLMLNDRGKDILLLGLGESKLYENIPIVGNGKSGFDAYHGPQKSKPYQKVIDYAEENHLLVFWSHPGAAEHVGIDQNFLGLRVLLNSRPYADELRNTENYDGFGIFSLELAQIQQPNDESIAKAEGLWDQLLMEYCRGQRKKPIWAIGEVDYNGFPHGIHQYDEILNMVWAPSKTRQAILQSLSQGKLYVTIPASAKSRVLLKDFSIQGNTVHIQIEMSDEAPIPMNLILIRNRSIIQRWEITLPQDIHFTDSENQKTGTSYYRIIGYSDQNPARLVSNPIFVEKS